MKLQVGQKIGIYEMPWGYQVAGIAFKKFTRLYFKHGHGIRSGGSIKVGSLIVKRLK